RPCQNTDACPLEETLQGGHGFRKFRLGVTLDEAKTDLAQRNAAEHEGKRPVAHEHDAIGTITGTDGKLAHDAHLCYAQVRGQADVALLEVGAGLGVDEDLARNFEGFELL